jgi:hypothetical protein
MKLNQHQLPTNWLFIDSSHQLDKLTVCKVEQVSGNSSDTIDNTATVKVSHCINIFSNFSYTTTSFNHSIDLKLHIKEIHDIDSLSIILSELDNHKICPGNPEFIHLAIERNGKFQGIQGTCKQI